MAPNGLDALEAIDALAAVRDQGVPSRANVMYGATGHRLGKVSLGRPLDNGLVALTIKRSWMAARLEREAESRGIVVRRGAEVSEPTDAGDRRGHAEGRHGAQGGSARRSRRRAFSGTPGHRCAGARSPPVGLTNFGGITRNTPIAGDLEPEAWHFIFGSKAFFGASHACR